jgi:hypothetical protein
MNESKPKGRAPRASRRVFLKTIAAGSAAALAAPALVLTAETAKPAKPRDGAAAAPKRPAALSRGIDEQKAQMKQTLETLRGYTLPTNAEQAFTFAPLRARRAERGQ